MLVIYLKAIGKVKTDFIKLPGVSRGLDYWNKTSQQRAKG